MIENVGSMADGRRRITAESFRLLTARLRSRTAPVAFVPDFVEALGASTPDPIVASKLPDPDPVFLEMAVSEPEHILAETAAGVPDEPTDWVAETPDEPTEWVAEALDEPTEWIAEATDEPTEWVAEAPPNTVGLPAELPTEPIAHADLLLPAFVPLAPLAIEEPKPSYAAEAGLSDDAFSAQPNIEAPAATYSTTSTEPVDGPDKSAPPMVERVADALLQTVTEAIYAKPTAAERAAFLREVAPPIETSEGDGALVEAEVPAELEPITVSAIEPPRIVHEPENIPESIAEKLGPSTALLLKPAEARDPDPFSSTLKEAIRLSPKPVETLHANADSGELALSLLDMMSGGAASGLPQERALAADTLLRMIHRVPVKQLIRVVERVAIMEAPPSLLVAKLIRDPRAEVVAPLLERCMHITDQDLMTAASEGDATKRRMIARRRILSPVLADYLIAIGDPSTILTLIRNPGATFSHEAFFRLADCASQHHALLAPLTTRADLPAPVAFELFWFVPTELRRFIFSRFLTDSETLSKILKITLGAQEGGETKFPAREMLESVVDGAAEGKVDAAAQILADIGGVCQETALRILADPHGEPVTVILKALGYPRGKFAEAMERFRHPECQLLRTDRNIAELESLFDTLSFNKARILLTYWDWFVQKSGPYAPQH